MPVLLRNYETPYETPVRATITPEQKGAYDPWIDKKIAEEEEERFTFELEKARRSGQYSVYVAARLIAQAAGPFINSAHIEERLQQAVHDKSLPAYTTYSLLRWSGEFSFVPPVIFFWDDLNSWLEKNEQRIGSIFQDPATFAASTKIEPQVKEAQHEKANQSIEANWKMSIQAQAAIIWSTYLSQGCSPTKHNIRTDLAKWCRENNIKTKNGYGINPSEAYISRHVLRQWKPPNS